MINGPLFWYTLKTKVVDIGPKVLNQLKNPELQIKLVKQLVTMGNWEICEQVNFS